MEAPLLFLGFTPTATFRVKLARSTRVLLDYLARNMSLATRRIVSFIIRLKVTDRF